MDQFDLLAQSVTEHVKRWTASLWGCAHRRTSFPMTLTGSEGSETYVVCTQCGKRFPYDWKNMSKDGPTP